MSANNLLLDLVSTVGVIGAGLGLGTGVLMLLRTFQRPLPRSRRDTSAPGTADPD